MTYTEILASVVFVVSILGSFIYYYTKLNVKIAEIQKDNNSIRKDFEEHKKQNEEKFTNFSEDMEIYRKENREDHKEIITTLNGMTKVLTDFRITMGHHNT
jgi:peroxiredoxin family protein